MSQTPDPQENKVDDEELHDLLTAQLERVDTETLLRMATLIRWPEICKAINAATRNDEGITFDASDTVVLHYAVSTMANHPDY